MNLKWVKKKQNLFCKRKKKNLCPPSVLEEKMVTDIMIDYNYTWNALSLMLENLGI